MENQTLTVRSALNKNLRYVITDEGKRLDIPDGWSLLPPGDAAVTKALKKLGPSWTAQRKKGRKVFSDGVWAPAENIESAKAMIENKRSKPEYARKRAADLKRRELKQAVYVDDFFAAVVKHLDFVQKYSELAQKMARLITDHATPVGSGTVARTERIPLEQRAAAAVNAWMRHQTTEYDNMKIARVKGRRREVRRELAGYSRKLLSVYRSGAEIDCDNCPLYNALEV